jgi:hypothetical protein
MIRKLRASNPSTTIFQLSCGASLFRIFDLPDKGYFMKFGNESQENVLAPVGTWLELIMGWNNGPSRKK